MGPQKDYGAFASAFKQTDCLAADESAAVLPIAMLESNSDARHCRRRQKDIVSFWRRGNVFWVRRLRPWSVTQLV
jgi:hypothetical protein